MSSRQFLLLAVALFCGALVGCGGGGGGPSTGTLNVKITDAPFPADCVRAAIICVTSVEARNESGWVEIPLVLPPAPVEPDAPEPLCGPGTVDIDLLDLLAGLSEKLALAEVPTGAYDEVRLVIEMAQLHFDGEVTQDFKAPSAMSSGIKIKIDPPILVASGQTSDLMLDVNLGESFHTAGEGGEPTCDDLIGGAKVIFHPVIRAINEAETALVLGTVMNGDLVPLGGVEVSAFLLTGGIPADAASAVTFSAMEGLDAPLGAYALALDPGSYNLYVRLGEDERQLALEDLVVVAGEIQTGIDLTYTPPAPAAPDAP